MSELEVFSKSIVKAAAGKVSPIAFLGSQVRKMEREDVDKLAVAYLFAQVRTRKRAEVLQVERDSSIINDAIRKKEQYARRGPVGDPDRWEAWAALEENAEAANAMRAQRDAAEAADEALARERQEWMNRMLSEWKSAIITEWTDDLLRSKFALGDGTETTWGDATREQHLYRINMHTAHALAGVEGAARHQQAIDQLDASGCLTLADAVKVAA